MVIKIGAGRGNPPTEILWVLRQKAIEIEVMRWQTRDGMGTQVLEHGGKRRMSKKSKTKTVHRSSVTGKFVTKKYAEKHPKTTEKERVKNA